VALVFNYERLSRILSLALRAKKNYDYSEFCQNVWHTMYQGICDIRNTFDGQDELLTMHADPYERASALHTDLMWNALFELFEELESLEKPLDKS